MLSNIKKYIEREASEQIKDTIACFWYTCLDFGASHSSFEIIPDGYAEIIFHFNKTCRISYEGKVQLWDSPFVMGLLNTPAIIEAKGHFEVIGVRCHPWAVFKLLELPTNTLNSFSIASHPISDLQASIQTFISGNEIDKALLLLEDYFTRIDAIHSTNKSITQAGKTIRNTHGTSSVSEVADNANMSVRSLERHFKQHSGRTVKDISGIMRFEQVRNHLWTYPNSNLAALAHDFGYTDQSHLIREFKKYSGTTPASFARKANKKT